jgi:hypothetical protein
MLIPSSQNWLISYASTTLDNFLVVENLDINTIPVFFLRNAILKVVALQKEPIATNLGLLPLFFFVAIRRNHCSE